MNKKLLAEFLALTTAWTLVVTVQAGGFSLVAAKTINVPKDYPSIQAAIDNAAPGEIIHVDSGTYKEHLVIDKSVLLMGKNKATSIIDGGETGIVIQIVSDNVLVANFTVRNAGSSQWFGHGFPDCDIEVQESADVAISNDVLSHATVGVWSYASTNVTCSGNSVSDTTTMGIIDYNCVNSSISGNHMQYCGIAGAHLDGGSQGCKIADNTIENCLEGIDIEKSNGNVVERDTLLEDNMSMVFTENSGNSVQYCTLQNGSVGVGFLQASGNAFTCNSFIGNARQVVSNFNSNSLSTNTWDNGTVGNYWSDYPSKYPGAKEEASAGTADTPYVIDASNVDHHPLMSAALSPSISPTAAEPEMTWLSTVPMLLSLPFIAIAIKRRKVNLAQSR